jgi:hypothetical protein
MLMAPEAIRSSVCARSGKLTPLAEVRRVINLVGPVLELAVALKASMARGA